MMRTKNSGQKTNKLFGKMSRKRKSRTSILTTSESDDSDYGSAPAKRQKGHWDPYCWLCHQENTNRRCSTCIRSYHIECIGSKAAVQSKVGYRCDLCIRMVAAKDDYSKRNVNMENIHRLLNFVTQRILENKDSSHFAAGSKFSQLRRPIAGGPNIINPFDLDIVKEKLEDSKYTSTLEFVTDIRWIRHNAEIVLNATDKRLEAARDMEELCDTEMYDIEMCDQCFDRVSTTDEWFTGVCNPPHLVVWARMYGHPYWPAKVIGLVDTGNIKIDVRFFGTPPHERQNILVSDTLLFSDNPNKKVDGSVEKDFRAAVKEAERYVKNIELKYDCKVVRAKPKSKFNVHRIGLHLTEMIPGLTLPHDFKLKRKPTYLKKYRRRKGPMLIKSKRSTVEQNGIQTKDCVVRLEKCDEMISMILSRQAANDKQPEHSQSGNDEAKQKERENGECEQDTNDELNATDLLEEISIPDEIDYDLLIHQAMEHVNRYDLVINLSPDCDSGASSMCYEISSSSSDDGGDVEQSSSGIQSLKTTETEEEMEESTIVLMNNERSNNESPKENDSDSDTSNDDISFVEISDNEEDSYSCRKVPAPRTYERHGRQKAVSGGENGAKRSLLNSYGNFVARKTYAPLHTKFLAIRRQTTHERPADDAHEKSLDNTLESPAYETHESPADDAHKSQADDAHEIQANNAHESPADNTHEKPVDAPAGNGESNINTVSEQGDAMEVIGTQNGQDKRDSIAIPNLFEDLYDDDLLNGIILEPGLLTKPGFDAEFHSQIDPEGNSEHCSEQTFEEIQISVKPESVLSSDAKLNQVTSDFNTESQANNELQVNNESQAKNESQVNAESQVNNETQANAESQANTEWQANNKSQVNNESQVNNQSQANVESQANAKSQSKTESQAIQSDTSNVKRIENDLITYDAGNRSHENVEPMDIAEVDENDRNKEDSPPAQTLDTKNASTDLENHEIPEIHISLVDTYENSSIADPQIVALRDQTITENVIKSKCSQNSLTQCDTSTNESQVGNNASSSSDDLLIDKFQVFKKNVAEVSQKLIEQQRIKLLLKENRINDLMSEIARLQAVESQLARLNEENRILKQDRDQAIEQKEQMEQELLMVKREHNVQVQKAIENAKNQELCSICKAEATITKFKPAFCSRECLHKQLEICKQSSDATDSDNVLQIQVNGQDWLETQAPVPLTNGHEEADPLNDEASFSEIMEY